MGWTNGICFPAGAEIFSLFHHIQTGFDPHSVSYPMGTGVQFFPWGVKWPGHEADHYLHIVPRLRTQAILPLPPYISIAWCLITCVLLTQ